PEPPAKEEANGKGVLPDMGRQVVMDSVLEGTTSLPSDSALTQQVRLKVKGLPYYNQRTIYHALKPILQAHAKGEGTTLDVWLGRTLAEANSSEVAAALSLIRNPRQASSWTPRHDVAWIQAHGIRGGIPRLGEIGRELSEEATLARSVLMEMAPQYRAEVLGVAEGMLHDPSVLVKNHGLEMARKLRAIELTPILRKLAFEKRSLVSKQAQRALLEIGDRSLVNLYRKILASPRSDFTERAHAAYGLGKLGYSQEAIPELRNLVTSANLQTRLAAAQALFRLGARGNIPSCRDLIENMGGRELLQLAEAALEGNHISHAQFFLSRALKQNDPGSTHRAIQLAVENNLQRLVPELQRLEGDTYPDIEWSAQRGQILLGGKRGDKAFLLEVLRKEFQEHPKDSSDLARRRQGAHRENQLLAAESLASLPLTPGERSLVMEKVRAISTSGRGDLNLEVASLLARHYGDRPSLQSLQYLLNYQDPMIRNQAARSLTQIRSQWDQGIRNTGQQIRRTLAEMKIAPSTGRENPR
ncbi:MAG: hypothetical protein R3257_07400, partial [bacterium]|nr:hypothetical protein [bacterium]